MSDSPESLELKLSGAIEQRDAVLVRQLMDKAEFVLLSMNDAESDGDDEGANVFSTEVDGMDLLVAFTNEEAAGDFVHSMEETYEEGEEIEGYVLDGGALLEYMPPEHGLFLNPESDDSLVIDHDLLALVQKAQA
ncbi:SseB family protein [Stieleria sp. TO1_6]|uniref:SseB family protein n=1 Tax=Stieleria tagensis TaxID=2956795 RepID=UPI00209B57E3|nr:SseB family protein [Stieleria tagensis]MCO8121612.1 SseB family protein [Stieleria tagensis]